MHVQCRVETAVPVRLATASHPANRPEECRTRLGSASPRSSDGRPQRLTSSPKRSSDLREKNKAAGKSPPLGVTPSCPAAYLQARAPSAVAMLRARDVAATEILPPLAVVAVG